MDIFLVCLLAVVGVLLMVLEMFFIPGFGLAGIASIAVSAGSIFLAYVKLGALAGHITLVAILIMMVVAIVVFLRTKSIEKMALKTDITDKVDLISGLDIKVGDKATTISRLAPMGKVSINGHELEAKSLGEFIDPENSVEIVRIEGNILVVKAI